MENRAADGRAIDENKFVEESSPQKPSWSSRYSVDRTALAMSGGLRGKDILDGMDREKMSARNMFASTAYNMKSTLVEGKPRVFGAGFTFRQKTCMEVKKTTFERFGKILVDVVSHLLHQSTKLGKKP
jgi:hypothetical protein